jgi:hypothetical protein
MHQFNLSGPGPGPGPGRRPPSRRPAAPIAAVLLAALVLGPLGSLAQGLDATTEALLVEAVEAAFESDLYNRRCRSDQSGRRTENLNKELVSRYRMTVLDVQDDLFPEGYYRDAQARMQQSFRDRLRALGGCDGAKKAGLRHALRERYEGAMAEIAEGP